jgi:hypothetical protein
MKWIDSGDIKSWINGKQRHCSQTLPELVRRLIFATADATSIEEIDFPSGDSITNSGWDGRLKTSVVSPFFPTGTSGWEMGIEKSPEKKAESDYQSRTADPLGFIHQDTTFVFVTPRPWPGRAKWQGRKDELHKWKGIRVIGADALEQWLDSAPAVALWLARQIGKIVSVGIRDLENVWEEWSQATNPTMTKELVLAGRTRDTERIHKWLNDKPSILSVQGDSPDEPAAFLFAAVAALPELSQVRVFSRCVVVENINELRQLTVAFQNPLTIAATGECHAAAGAAVVRGHHVFLGTDAKVIDIGSVFRLSRPQHSVIEKNLRSQGLSQLEAQRLARDFGRSIPVLRRHLYRSSAVNAPVWANAESAGTLLPALLAGAWTEDKPGDREVLSALSELDHDTLTAALLRFTLTENAPIRRVANVWMLKSPLDAWFLLARHLNNDYLKRFRQAVIAVLTKTDPKYDLPAEQRWAATIYGKPNPYSEWLRSGLVESLTLLAVYGDRAPLQNPGQAFADVVVKEILGAAQSWEAWASIKDVTPLLAEASPTAFLCAVEQVITKTPMLFQELMKDDPGVFGECRHSGLLWALEAAAWSPEYFGRAVNGLAELAKIDPGGRWSNRAIESLREVFLPRYPQTYASPQERLGALDQLAARDPRTAWEFSQNYFGQGHFSESYRFRWRDSGGERRGLEPEQSQASEEYVTGLRLRLNELARDRKNLVDSLDGFTRLPLEMRQELIAELERTDPASVSEEERERLLQATRQALNWINSYGNEKQRMHVKDLDRVLEKFAPKDVLKRVGWLLSNPWPRLPEGEPASYEGRDDRVMAAQERAAREVLDKVPMEELLAYAAGIQHVAVLGHALGKAVRNPTEDETVLAAILGRAADTPLLITGYAVGRIEATDQHWVQQKVERLQGQRDFSPEACALLYLALPEGAGTWSAVSALGKDVERAYWKRASGYSREDLTRDTPTAVEKLLEVNRPRTALEIAGNPNISVPSALLKLLIQKFLSLDQKETRIQAGAMTEFHLGHIFKQLYERGELPIEEIAQLEWPFAALFEGLRSYTSSPLAIHRLLQRNPSFFAQLIAFMYKRDDRSPDLSQEDIGNEARQNLAHNARLVVDSWRLLPGLNEDGSFDGQQLSAWVDASRQECAATRHVTGGDLQIGFMLAHAPADADGSWPHTAVRDLVERLNNDVVDEHIQMGIYNSRGATSRGLTDGGAQERDLADRYKKMSEAVKLHWPRTAAMLRSIADSYTRDAERHDILSELNDLRWN